MERANATDLNVRSEIEKLEHRWSGKMKSIRKTLSSGVPASPVVNSMSWMNIARFPTQNLEALMDSRWGDIERRIQMITESCKELKNEYAAAVSKVADQFPRIEQRLAAVEKQLADIQGRFEEIKRVEGDIKEARQKQYETFMDDRGKLRVDYLDLKQEVTQKLKVMQMRLEDLIAASAAAALASSQAPSSVPAAPAAAAPGGVPASADFLSVESLAGFSAGSEEKGAFRRFLDWWNEPVFRFLTSKPE